MSDGRVRMKLDWILTFLAAISSTGFHSNIVTALEDLKSDEAFVDVTLSCEGETIQARPKQRFKI